MTRSDALRDLLAKVEAGWFDATDTRAARFNDFYKLAEVALGDTRGIPALAWDVYGKHSLDAAKALHEAVLPGWAWDISSTGEVSLYEPCDDEWEYGSDGVNDSPARAWFIAILKALIATEDN